MSLRLVLWGNPRPMKHHCSKRTVLGFKHFIVFLFHFAGAQRRLLFDSPLRPKTIVYAKRKTFESVVMFRGRLCCQDVPIMARLMFLGYMIPLQALWVSCFDERRRVEIEMQNI